MPSERERERRRKKEGFGLREDKKERNTERQEKDVFVKRFIIKSRVLFAYIYKYIQKKMKLHKYPFIMWIE